jgi:hypothetical protein
MRFVGIRFNSTCGRNAALPIDGSGRLTVACHQAGGSTHFILDVAGYFE